jgi:glycosyltransferase involved in cell wall biosynthesis
VSVGRLLAGLRVRQTGRTPRVLPNGVDWGAYADARRREPGGQTLIYVGNLISWSGLEPALEALARLAPELPNARLVVVGDGLPAYVERLRRRTKELGLEDRVRFLGQRAPAELPALLAEADVGLANSEPVAFRRYACPLKVLEYMAAGRPVVATRGTEAGDLVERAGAGVAVAYDVDALTRELERLLRDGELRGSFGRAGVRHSEALDWERLLGRELELLGGARTTASEEVA